MRHVIGFFAPLVLLCSIHCVSLAQSTLLDNATVIEFEAPVNDVVYDPTLDVLYASIPSIAGFPFGNSIATIDPATGSVVDSVFVGSEPNTLAISDDGSHVFVGLDGARSVRSYQPATGALSPIVSLSLFSIPSVAQDIAVLPNQPSVAVISSDSVGTSASGALRLFDGSTVVSLSNDFAANEIDFIGPTTLAALNTNTTGFQVAIAELNGTSLNTMFNAGQAVSDFDISFEAGSDGLFYFSEGTVSNPASPLDSLGTFRTGFSATRQLVEPVPDLELVYFVGPSGGNLVLTAFNTNNFSRIDSTVLPIAATTAEDGGELIVAGQDRLAFVFKEDEFDGAGGSGTLNIITGVPAAPTPVLLGDCNQDGAVDFLDISPLISTLSNGDFRAEADINEDGVVDFLDVGPFIELLSL